MKILMDSYGDVVISVIAAFMILAFLIPSDNLGGFSIVGVIGDFVRNNILYLTGMG